MVESKFAFLEPKTIQRMELLVLSALQWKMHPVTPFCFFHHIIRRLPLKNHMLWEVLGRFQCLILSIIAGKWLKYLLFLVLNLWFFAYLTEIFHNEMIGFLVALIFSMPDHRFLCYLPSVLATATILHIISEIEPYNFLEYQNVLLSVLKINKVLKNMGECLNV